MDLEPRQPRRDPLQPEGAPMPVVSYAVIGLSVLVYFVLDTALPATVIPGRGLLSFGALYGPLVRDGEYWRVLTTAVEHGGILHLVLNMSVVWTLGTSLERVIGSPRFLLLSLITCLGASFFVLLFSYDGVTVGASGMILGWAGAMLPISTREGRRSLGTWLAQIVLISVLPLFLRAQGHTGFPMVSWQGHLGGFLFGLPVGFALKAGPRQFRLAAPILLFLTAVACLAAAHPEAFHP